jgi:cytochrome c oxidase subunit 2
MNRISILSSLLLIIVMSSSACGGGSETIPTKVPEPVATSTPAPIATSAPTEVPTEAPSVETVEPTKSSSTGTDAVAGQELSVNKGCVACHSIDGSAIIGPTWKGLYGSNEALEDGSSVTVDDAYIKESILNPTIKVAKGFQPVMPVLPMSDDEIAAVTAYIKSLK